MPRQLERFPISLEIVLESSSGKREARISDLSMGGCFVDTIANVRDGEIVGFKLSLPTGQWVQLSGEVVYVLSGLGFGIRFTKLLEEEQKLFEQIILSNGGEPWRQADSEAKGEIQPAPPISQNGGRILLVDDDPKSRDITFEVSKEEGYEVLAMRDTREAYNFLQTDPDFIAAIFDIVMADLQELKLVRYMKSETGLQQIPVGIITTLQNPILWHESLAVGARMLLPKPFLPEQMRYMLKVLTSQITA